MITRQSTYRWIARDIFSIPEGTILPKWIIAIRFVLFPLQSIRWWLNGGEGYNLMTDTWYIHKTHFSSDFLLNLSNNSPYWYRVTKDQWGNLTVTAVETTGDKSIN